MGLLAVAAALCLLLPGTALDAVRPAVPLAASSAALVLGVLGFARAPPRERLWRGLLLPGLATILAGAIEWVLYDSGNIEGFSRQGPRAADVLHLAPLVLALFSLMSYPSRSATSTGDPGARPLDHDHRMRSSIIIILDSLLIVVSTLLIVWIVLLREVAASGVHGLTFTLGITHATAGSALVVAVILMWTFRRPRNGRAMALLTGGMGLTAVSEAAIVHVVVVGPTPVNQALIAWPGLTVGPLLIALAIVAPPCPRQGEERVHSARAAAALRWGHLYLPYLPFGVASALVVLPAARGDSLGGFTLQLAFVLAALVTIRQVITIAQNARLLTRIQAAQRSLHHQAHHDPLTGLANRALFTATLDRAVAEHREHGTPLALLYCDIDKFKPINDTFGHAAGDDLLRAVAGRLRGAVREQDLPARLGGDEFAVLLQDVDDPWATGQRTAERVAEAMDSSFMIHSRPCRVSVSVGVAVTDAAESAIDTSEDLLRRADQAMYSAKKHSRPPAASPVSSRALSPRRPPPPSGR
ncbi:GGDEF domain-containing protein [Frankia sp. CNm7]|uniref:GGDEF domain-containing protein n=1 Tax=Frankia nepalensis TaxID=1836974 RepID=A0A937RFH0_9ACTN|nr:GGDEF domain-containing protein [Frankia nepalensis]MBL7499765.1 GGDEF domain-containing protein [Frankia nepalensis]MBL7512250.1 GGDEF domain-containing protein [Frankia nepalensis]MBL7524090.1 GGDEF domain-containing protein [Frankia nepalensis]MBL7629052.1 GGDEF domain-containing protein [Frankia nepalensis]